jgi:hypothetical protein
LEFHFKGFNGGESNFLHCKQIIQDMNNLFIILNVSFFFGSSAQLRLMENVLSDIKDADIYIDGVGAFSNDWDHHVNLLAIILRQLRENGFSINPRKCE